MKITPLIKPNSSTLSFRPESGLSFLPTTAALSETYKLYKHTLTTIHISAINCNISLNR